MASPKSTTRKGIGYRTGFCAIPESAWESLMNRSKRISVDGARKILSAAVLTVLLSPVGFTCKRSLFPRQPRKLQRRSWRRAGIQSRSFLAENPCQVETWRRVQRRGRRAESHFGAASLPDIANPYKTFVVDVDAMFPLRPLIALGRSAPRVNKITRVVKHNHRWRGHRGVLGR